MQVHRSGDIGSPRVSGSPNSSSAPSKPGSVAVSGLRPPPGARTRSDTGAPSTSSAMPLLMVSGCNLLVRQPGPHHPALSHVPQPGHQPPLPLVQVRKHAPELLTQNLIRPTSHSHAGTLSPQPQNLVLITTGPLGTCVGRRLCEKSRGLMRGFGRKRRRQFPQPLSGCHRRAYRARSVHASAKQGGGRRR